MSLRPRHFVLLAIVLGIFVFKVVQRHREQHIAVAPQNPLTAPAWAAYEKAAALRDAPDDQFKPAFAALRTATEGRDSQEPATADQFNDLFHCKIWLDFYRRDASWKANASKHVKGCVQYHRDTVA